MMDSPIPSSIAQQSAAQNNNNANPSESYPGQHKEHVRGFVKQVILAAKRQEEKKQAKLELDQHIHSIKKMTVSKIEKEAVEEALKKLDQKINAVLEKEGKLLVNDIKESALTNELQQRITELETRLMQVGKNDIALIDNLKGNILNLRKQLFESEQTNRQKMESINSSMNGLQSKLQKYFQDKEERDLRLEELEEKIRQRTESNSDDIQKLEMQVMVFEEKFDKASKMGRYNHPIARKIKEKLDIMKQKLMFKKSGMSESQQQFLMHVPEKSGDLDISKELPPPPVNLPRMIKPTDQVLFSDSDIRHDMKFDSSAENDAVMPGDLPPLPPLPAMPKNLKVV